MRSFRDYVAHQKKNSSGDTVVLYDSIAGATDDDIWGQPSEKKSLSIEAVCVRSANIKSYYPSRVLKEHAQVDGDSIIKATR